MCTFVEFCLLTVKLQGPLAATKSDGFGKKLFASACPRHVFYSFHYFSIFIHFPWRVMLQPPVFITMSRGSKLSVSSITGSSAVATNSFTPQLEDSSGLTPWRPHVEASHPAAKLSRWRSSSDLGRDRFGSWVFNPEVVLATVNRYERTVCAFIYQSNFASMSTHVCQTFNISFLWICGRFVTCDIVMERMLLCPKKTNYCLVSISSYDQNILRSVKCWMSTPIDSFIIPPSYHIEPLQDDSYNPTSASFAPSMRCDALTLGVVIATKVTTHTHTHSPRAHLSQAKFQNESLEPLLEIRPGACSE